MLGAPEMLQPYLAADAHLGTFLEEQTARGMRVLLFAWHPEPTQLQSREGEAQLPHGLIPLGEVSLRDTLRPEARETLARLADVGVQIKVISGDHPQTVAALARQVGSGSGYPDDLGSGTGDPGCRPVGRGRAKGDHFRPHHAATKGAAGTGTAQSWSLCGHDR